MITPAQTKAARALLGWSQEELAQKAGVVRRTLISFETGERIPREETLQKVQGAFEKAGIEFIGLPTMTGVLLRSRPQSSRPQRKKVD